MALEPMWAVTYRGIEYFLGKRYSLKILPRSQNLGGICDRSQSLVLGDFASRSLTFFKVWDSSFLRGVSNQSLTKSQIYHSIPLKLDPPKTFCVQNYIS